MIVREGDHVNVSGALTIENAAAVATAGKQELHADTVFDLTAVTEVDSTALSVLFEWRRAAKERNVQVSFHNLPASMQSLAALYGVADLVAP
jgi:phospholipid transport system transporter-binding protein